MYGIETLHHVSYTMPSWVRVLHHAHHVLYTMPTMHPTTCHHGSGSYIMPSWVQVLHHVLYNMPVSTSRRTRRPATAIPIANIATLLQPPTHLLLLLL